MVFSSVVFLFYFLPIFIILYTVAPHKAKNLVLLVGSLFFYAWGEPVYILLMVFSILVNYIFGRLIGAGNRVKLWLTLGIIVNLLLIGVFKYADFICGNINSLFGTSMAEPGLPLPIGISFYTFQAMSYLIDLARGEVRLQKNIINFATYISMFPQLIAGPIVRLKDVEGSLEERTLSLSGAAYGIRRFIIGLGKKVLLANNAGMIFDSITASAETSGAGTLTGLAGLPVLTAWLAAIAFTFQIYFDFSGYSDMAIGLGSIMGFRFPENFNYPYISRSITEFWRRWHISLSTWFREYVYIPLGGNRKGPARQVLNLLIVWLLTGMWHGASWNFIMWGLYYGLLLIFEKILGARLLTRLPAALQHLITMVLVIFGWIIFSLESPADIISLMGACFGISGTLFNAGSVYILRSNAVLLLLLAFGATDVPKRLWTECAGRLEKGTGQVTTLESLLENLFLAAVLIISIAYITAGTYNPFLYFRF